MDTSSSAATISTVGGLRPVSDEFTIAERSFPDPGDARRVATLLAVLFGVVSPTRLPNHWPVAVDGLGSLLSCRYPKPLPGLRMGIM